MVTIIELTDANGHSIYINANIIYRLETITFLEDGSNRIGTKITPYLPHSPAFTVRESRETIRDLIREETQLLNGMKK